MEKTQRILIGILLLTILLLSVIVIILVVNNGAKESNDTEFDPRLSQSQNTNDEPNCVSIPTPYIDLQFPIEWENNYRYETTEENGSYIVTFIGCVNDIEQELYSIVFGDKGDIPLGNLPGDEGVLVPVWLNMVDFEIDESWSGEEADTICALQETMNYTSEKIEAQCIK